MKKQTLKDSPYVIQKGKILRMKKLTDMETYFEIALPGGHNLGHEPGQFVQVSILGVGEAPISVSSSPTKLGSFELVVRRVGKFTQAMHALQPGDEIGIRGPFGRGFPVQILEGNDLLFIAGGIGIVPLRSLINYVIDNRRDFGRVAILLGCKEPKEFLFREELEQWEERLDVEYKCTVDRGDDDWQGNVGLITSLIPGVTLDPDRTFAVVCGPPIMYKFVLIELSNKKIPERQTFLSLERHMKCGLGKCGHCQINNYYCCQDGPVFSYDQIKDVKEAI